MNKFDKESIACRVLGMNGYTIQTKASLAREYGVSPRTIGRIVDKYREENPMPIVVDARPSVEPNVEYTYKFVATSDSIAITREMVPSAIVSSETEMVSKSDSRYQDIFDLVFEYNRTGDEEKIEEAFRLICLPEAIRHYSHGRITADLDSGTLTYTNSLGGTSNLSGRLVTRVLDALHTGEDSLTGLMAFSERLIDNPSFEAIERLFDFIEHTDIEITDEGHLICFKRVRGDFTDVRTRSFDNSPGKLVQEPRNEVNPDNQITCGKGLHVCAKHYLNHYPGQRVIRCQVNPRDVVAIPYDYDNSKMRVCEYLVIDEWADYDC